MGREGANKRAFALIFKRNYCIQFSTFIAPWGWELPWKWAGILGVSFKSV